MINGLRLLTSIILAKQELMQQAVIEKIPLWNGNIFLVL